MRQAKVLFKDKEAGILTQHDDGIFVFSYCDNWIADSTMNSISLSLPKSKKDHYSKILFSFFYNMLPEGSNKQIVCKYNKIDKNDSFGLLLVTAKEDNIGAISVQNI